MHSPNKIPASTFSEVNLKVFVDKVLERKWLFMISLPLCLMLAYAYTKFATPVFEVNTSILIDPSGQSRMLGESKYVEGGVGLIGTEKNLYNEIGILKSRSLVGLTLEELDFDISYFTTDSWFRKREHYGYFPFKVELIDTSQQMYHADFKVTILSPEEYQLSVESEEFVIARPNMSTEREVKEPFLFTETFQFGEPVLHDYFHFTLQKPLYKLLPDKFEDKQLSFQINSLQGFWSVK
ncbi:MAG: Wzz/FepE/Etk N-terminal domain-containing protein [Bacteroidota bacterium]